MNPDSNDNVKAQSPPPVCYVLQAFAVMIVIMSVIGLFVALADVSRLPEGFPGTGRLIFISIAVLVGGLAASAAMVALAAAVQYLSRIAGSLAPSDPGRLPALARPTPSAEAGQTQAAGQGAQRPDNGQFEAMQRVLEEMRDNIMLTEEERRAKRQRLVAMERRERATQIQHALDGGRFHDARAMLLDLERRTGSDEETRQLAEHIAATAAKAEGEDVAAATRQCEDLMSLTSWDRAFLIAEDLIKRHPDSPQGKQLLSRIQRERQVHQQEHRNRLYVEIQRHTSRREWHQALLIAGQLISAYPDSIEAESLREQMETLTKNAEIEHRRELETKYKGFIEDRKFAEALALAREVIGLYPDSPQAKVLREQIPALEKHIHASFAKQA